MSTPPRGGGQGEGEALPLALFLILIEVFEAGGTGQVVSHLNYI